MTKEALSVEDTLKLALEALEQWNTPLCKRGVAITSLRKAIALQALHDENERLGLYKDAYAQPEQEEYLSKAYRLANELRCHLAIAPAPQRKPLTDEQIKGIYEDCDAPTGGEFTIAFTRAIEAAHGIKE